MRQHAEAVRQAISNYRALPPAACKVSTLELVELRRESATYRWRSITGVDLL
jgi:hypothetical protein